MTSSVCMSEMWFPDADNFQSFGSEYYIQQSGLCIMQSPWSRFPLWVWLENSHCNVSLACFICLKVWNIKNKEAWDSHVPWNFSGIISHISSAGTQWIRQHLWREKASQHFRLETVFKLKIKMVELNWIYFNASCLTDKADERSMWIGMCDWCNGYSLIAIIETWLREVQDWQLSAPE